MLVEIICRVIGGPYALCVVAQRTNEFGIRMALGAQPGDVMRIVFSSTVVSVGSGIAAGLALTLMMNRILESWVGGNAKVALVPFPLALALFQLLSSTRQYKPQ